MCLASTLPPILEPAHTQKSALAIPHNSDPDSGKRSACGSGTILNSRVIHLSHVEISSEVHSLGSDGGLLKINN